MKVYQLIYTSVKYSLSDSSLSLENGSGRKIYSCTQGLTKDEIDEIVCFCGYKKPDECEIEYSDVYADPSIPESFPKTFRTFKLSSGKYAAIQVVFSGVDIDGADGNFFAHAFVFDEVEDGFAPEYYYGSEDFRTHLLKDEMNLSLVRYLPRLSDVKEQESLNQWIDLFSKEHKVQISQMVDAAVEILSGKTDKTHLCISAPSSEESDYYLLALKRLLPRELSDMSGISTNNTYLPSDKQQKILFNATVSGFNNITEEQVNERAHCIYLDFCTEISTTKVYERLFEMTGEELFEQYERLGIDTIEKFSAWLIAYNRTDKKGIGKRLLQVREINPELYIKRCMEIYSEIDRADLAEVRFEILNAMYENAEDFSDIKKELIENYFLTGIRGIVSGEPVNMEAIFKNSGESEKEHADLVYGVFDEAMSIISEAEINEQQATLLLRMFAIVKQAGGFMSWKEFFKNRHEYMVVFVELAASVIINDSPTVAFIAPIIWTNAELAEVVAYFDSSTDDAEIKKGCRKFILNNIRENWSRYGIEISKEEKSREDREKDISLVRKMLSSVGYVPFQRGRYQDLKFDVFNDIETNDNPLLITRLLNAYYNWQMTELETEAKQYAIEMQAIILEIREKENSCYKFIFPKLAIEMLSVSGMYHEIVINCETMLDIFWNWFLIGAEKNKNDEFVFRNYQQVFDKNESDLRRLAIYRRLKKIFNKEKGLF